MAANKRNQRRRPSRRPARRNTAAGKTGLVIPIVAVCSVLVAIVGVVLYFVLRPSKPLPVQTPTASDPVSEAVQETKTMQTPADGIVIPARGGLRVEDIVSFDMWQGHAAASTKDGSLYVWGEYTVLDGTFQDVSVPVKIMDDVKQVCTGYRNYLILKTDGSLYFLGGNNGGRVCEGMGDVMQSPVKIMDDVRNVSMYYDSCFAFTNDGSLYSWGVCAGHALGRYTYYDDPVPAKILDNAKSVNIAGDFGTAITEDGLLYVWGYKIGTLIGKDGQDNRSRLQFMDHVAEVAVGENLLILTDDGSLYTADLEKLCEPARTGRSTDLHDCFQPVKIMDDVKAVDCAGNKNAVIKNDNSLYLWGKGVSFERGDDSHLKDIDEPTKVMDQVASFSFYGSTAAAFTTDGRLYMWGSNNYGQFGNGTTEDSDAPVEIIFAS